MKKRVTKGARAHLRLVVGEPDPKRARKPVDPPLLIDRFLADLAEERARRHVEIEERYRDALRRFLAITTVAEFRTIALIVAERKW